MKICLLTYDTQHRKTAEVFLGLHNHNRYDISFLTVPFTKRPAREVAFAHRPDQFTGVSTRTLAEAYGADYYSYEQREDVLDSHDFLIVCGANILEPKFANSGKILNGHAGLIPHVRGLDSFKWAVLDQRVIGNTLHIIDERADQGRVLHQIKTPLFTTDTLQDFADRHYNNEIWMLTHFESLLSNGTIFDLEENDARMRMSLKKEALMLAAFDDYKAKFSLR